jgi:iron complex transport system substrate-binding protein
VTDSRTFTLQATGLTVGFGAHTVIDGLDLRIRTGVVTALIGPNASGKSTLLGALARLLSPTAGSVLLNGSDIGSIPTRQVARQLGILPQAPVAPDGITVAELVRRGRHPHRRFGAQRPEDDLIVASALLRAGVGELADRGVDTLSGGQRQRVWIAMALAQQTPVLLLDEPTSSLDIAHQVEVLDLLVDLQRDEGKTIVIVLHDLNQAAHYASTLVVLSDGAVVAAGPPTEVITESLVERVFGVPNRVIADPDTGSPLVLPRGRHDLTSQPDRGDPRPDRARPLPHDSKGSPCMRPSILRRFTVATAATALAALTLAGCSGGGTATGTGESPTSSAAVSPAAASTSYPLILESPYGTTTLDAKPAKVAVVSSVDLDVALALGGLPVIAPQYGDAELEPWSAAAVQALGQGELTTYDSTDGTDFEAIAAAAPDVILATSGWTLDTDYEQLSKIAPVVSYQGEDGLAAMSWADRTQEAATALDLAAEGEEALDRVDTAFSEAATANPEFDGKTITYAVLHPDQITYISHQDSDMDVFTNLGFVLPANAAQFSDTNDAVSRENVDVLDADVLLIGYPFGDEGVLTRSELEADPLFQQIPAVANGHYAVVDDAVASPLAYPTPLSQTWVLEQLVPVLATAVAGTGSGTTAAPTSG